MAEWFKAAVLKTAVGASLPWVRIPPCPPECALGKSPGAGNAPEKAKGPAALLRRGPRSGTNFSSEFADDEEEGFDDRY